MARKEFRYRGYTVDELKGLSTKEFTQLLPSRERRSLARGMTEAEQSLVRKLAGRDKVKTHAREMIILPDMVGKTILVHNGKAYTEVLVQEEMVGHRLGEFALTRKKAAHSAGKK